MTSQSVVLIVSTSRASADQLRGLLEAQHDIEVMTQVLNGEKSDNLPSVPLQLVVLDLGERGETMLSEWSRRTAGERGALPMIVVGPVNDSVLMRRAMRAGARDYFTRPIPADEFLAAVHQVLYEQVESMLGPQGHLTAVLNAKGGSGASFIACNVAHLLTAQRRRSTALLDLDLQFGALPLSLDLKPRDSMFDAIASVERLDSVALKGYMTPHASGLHVLSAMSEQLVLPSEVPVGSLKRVLELSVQTYEHVVIDLPRQIDPLTSMVLARADHVLLVMQQSFAHLRDAKRMLSLLTGYLELSHARISVVVNRYNEKDAIGLKEINAATQSGDLLRIPNDFEQVTASLNLGVPLFERAPHAAITTALMEIASRADAGNTPVETQPAATGDSAVKRMWSGLRGNRR